MAKGAGIERWEEGFDSWTAGRGGVDETDTGTDLDREALLRLARELADKRHADQEQSSAELERIKQSLRERAEAIAARERELDALEQRLGKGKPPKATKVKQARSPEGADAEALAARERAALERSKALEARELELRRRAAELEAHAEEIAGREAELARAQSQLDVSLSERELASAERAQLEARSEEARRAERELAARRLELDEERERLDSLAHEVGKRSEALEPIVPAGRTAKRKDPATQRETELRRLEAKLEARERELALVRQGLDAERNALLERERALRRREAAEFRHSHDDTPSVPTFSEGLAAFVSSRGRH